MLVVSARGNENAREITTAAIHLKAHILRNGTDDKFEIDTFKSGYNLYLSFMSPVSGYLATYLVDADNQAFCLLPYRDQTNGIYPIKANHRYLFFNEQEATPSERSLVDEYVMTCEHSSEHNQIYIVFSPHPFVKATDNNVENTLPRQLCFEDFNKWLVKYRKMDKDMCLKKAIITINQ